MKKCGEEYGKGRWSVGLGARRGVGKCWGRCRKVCWGVRGMWEVLGAVWESMLECEEVK